MIKCLCKENVQDRLTGENYIAGKEYSFTKERAEEVTSTKYFELVKVEEEEIEEKPTKKSVKKSAKK